MCSSLISVAMIKYSDQEHLWKEKIYLAFTSGSLSIIEGREIRSGTEAGAMEVCWWLPYSWASVQVFSSCSPRSGAAQSGLDPPTSVINQDNPL